MENLEKLRARMRAENWQAFVVPSTDEYLSEFSQPISRRLGWLTGFRGSVGLAVILPDRAALFLDGRYQAQGRRETHGLNIEVKAWGESVRNEWLAAHLNRGDRVGIDTRLQSYGEIAQLEKFLKQRGVELADVPRNPIDELWGGERPSESKSPIFDYPIHCAGVAASEKLLQLRGRLRETGVAAHLVADPEDIAWLLNVRTDEARAGISTGWPIVPAPLSRVLVEQTGGVTWFVEASRLEPSLATRIRDSVEVLDPSQIEAVLERQATNRVVSANLRRTPYKFAKLIDRVGTLRDDAWIARSRWRKNPAEIARAREGHFLDGQAVIRFLAWIQREVHERVVMETEAAQKLESLKEENPAYRGPSMATMSASGPSGAMAHYVPNAQSDRALNDHPLFWIDSGGQYLGCSTDNTACIALSKPEPRHVRAHTTIVKAQIALASARFPVGTSSAQLDVIARQHLWQHGMDYSHATGHGVGNFMNIHEGPHLRKELNHPMVVPVEAGMILANEPGFYCEGDFGVRVESHMVTVESLHEGFLEFETISRLPIDPSLIDGALLSDQEKRWLANYHAGICDGYTDCFDSETTMWLRSVADSYVTMADASRAAQQ